MTQAQLALDVPSIDVERLVKFTPHPADFQSYWDVNGGTARYRDRTGKSIGVIEIRNARAHGIVLQFDDGAVAAFHPHDLFPARVQQ